ncbi:hypothetical protein M404DRAFT_756865 [Pisolithus tinctorius Marx 270]|uniref:Uncharacterized protein n=1 Tax=Pisolithus tinctorius Marx 270 TaxID=870435 RepID=A0A0C3NZW7_PISTI|nr:hypothetical protein M404DRAFT_756865 [Pisolithus tinctorius Marx 270]
MIGLGIAIEVALHISRTQNGFHVPEKNVFSFASTQFLTSFFPTLLVVPLAYFWSIADWMLRWYQPYITLAEGSAPASRSILLDYIALNQIAVLFYSFKYKHYLVYISTVTVLIVILLQPLAGSLLEVQQVPHSVVSTAISTRAVALSPDVTQLDAYLASAGYADAAVYGNLGDPPYVYEEWTAALFEPASGVSPSGTLAVNTTGLQTEVNCNNPESLNLTSSGDSYSAQAAFPNACFASFSFGTADGSQQYSVINASSCAPAGQEISFQPVVFWYYLQDTSATNDPQVSAIFCQPSMRVFTMSTSMNLGNGALGDCTILQDFTESNNVTGDPLNGQIFNGVMFDESSNIYVAARAIAINSGLPGTVYRYASQQPNGIQSVFDDPYGWLNATSKIYTQHLAVAAQANYFGQTNTTIPALLITDAPRLFVEALPAHLLSSLMFLIGIAGLIVHLLHARSRRKLWLTSPPGSIASIVSLTSRSGFGELLLPYDDESRMRSTLSGLKFHLDQRTGAIVAEEGRGFDASGAKASLLGHEEVFRSPMF